MTIQLNHEQEQIVAKAMRAGLISSVDEVVAMGIDAVRTRLAPDERESGPLKSSWLSDFNAWLNRHPHQGTPLSDEASDRDDIYGSRGL